MKKSAWNVLYSKEFLGRTIDSALVEKMKGRWSLLKEFEGHVIDESLVEHLKLHHEF